MKELAPLGYFTLSRECVILETNQRGLRMLVNEASSIKLKPFDFYISNETKPIFNLFLCKVFTGKTGESCEVTLIGEDKISRFVYLSGLMDDNKVRCTIAAFDITERKMREVNREEAARLILMVNTSKDFRECMSELTTALQGWSGCEAVGVRLQEGDDYPYFETRGFPAEFVRAENKLCTYGTDGVPELECMCGNIICGRFDTSKPFFTVQGSFWSNNTTDLLASTTEADRQARTRNRCNSAGYESVALIPLRAGEQVFGLLQFNDHRPDRFTPELISDFERMADCFAFVLLRRQAEQALRKSEKLFRDILQTAMDGFWLVDMKGRILNVNDAYCRMSGYSSGELLWMSVSDLEAVESIEDTIARIQKIIAYGEDFFETRHRRKDGSLFDVEVSVKYQSTEGHCVAFLRDITERKQAEAELRNSEARFRSYLELPMHGVAITSPEKGWLHVNDRICAMLGYLREEITRMTWEEISYPDDLAKNNEQFNLIMSGQIEKYSLEKRFICKDRRIIWTNISVGCVRKSDRNVDYFICLIEDISERKVTEEKIKLLSSAVKSANDGIIISDMQGKVNFANESAIHMYGYTLEEMMKLNVASFNSDPKLASIVTEILIQSGNWNGESLCVKKNGRNFPTNLSVSIILDNNKIPMAMMAIVRDVTDSKRIEEELSESEQKFRDLFNNSEVGMFRTRFDGSEILECNEKYLKILNYTHEELKGRPSVNLWADKNERDEMMEMLNAEGHVTDFECRLLDKQGQIRHCISSLRLYRDKGILEGSILDITERKQAEEALRESEEKYRNLFAHNPQAMWIYNLDTLAFLEVNDAAVNQYGYSRKEFLKMTIKDVRPEEDIPALLNDVESTNHNYNRAGIWRHLKKNGELIFVEITSHSVIFNERNARQVLVIDITDRILAEEALRKSQQILEAIINTIPVRVFWKDKNLNYLGCNTPFASDAGFTTSKDVIGKDDYVMSWSESADLYRADDRVVIESGSPKILFEEMLATPTGLPTYLLTSKVPLKEANGEIIGVLGTYLDITERKKAEEQLKLLSRAIEQSPVTVMITDKKGNIEYVNPKFTELTGYSKDEVKGKKPNVLQSGQQDDNFYEELWKTILSGNEWHGEFHNKKKNGDSYWESALISPILNNLGDITSFIAIKEDITEKKKTVGDLIKAKEKAEENEFLLQESQKVGHIGSYKTDFIAGYWESSETLDEIFGIDKYYDRSIKGWLDIVHPDECNTLNDYLINEVIAKKIPFEREYRIVRINDKQTRWVQGFGATSFDASGAIIEMIGTIQDITERKVFEFELKTAKERAVESDRLKSAFLANMSHEIRTPMNGILGFAGLLKEPKLTGEEQKEYIGIIEKSGERMLNIINDIINISKVESGQMQVFISETNINEQIDYIYTFFKPEAEQKGIEISFKNRLRGKGAFIKTDREKVYAILTNLVKNAIKFTRRGSIEIGCEKKTDYLEFYVKDTGRGIPKEQLAIIFERFRQVDDSLHRKFEGAGLGLSISKAFVEMLGGKIWVDSKYKEGSIFYFTLPHNIEMEENNLNKLDVPDTKSENGIKNLKILIAEDDELSTILLIKTLKANCREILKARTGTEAVETLRANPDIDLILMDIQMPEIDGYRATKQIRQFNNDVIIIAQTAFALSGDRERAIESGCNDYVAKPISQVLLNDLIKKYF